MSNDVKITPTKTARVSAPESDRDRERERLYFNTVTLSRFMKACYGADAAKEAKRHIDVYREAGDTELTDIWKRVHAHIVGIEIKEDVRRTLKFAKPLQVKDGPAVAVARDYLLLEK